MEFQNEAPAVVLLGDVIGLDTYYVCAIFGGDVIKDGTDGKLFKALNSPPPPALACPLIAGTASQRIPRRILTRHPGRRPPGSAPRSPFDRGERPPPSSARRDACLAARYAARPSPSAVVGRPATTARSSSGPAGPRAGPRR